MRHLVRTPAGAGSNRPVTVIRFSRGRRALTVCAFAMKIFTSALRRYPSINLPAACLLALLQRTPVVRVAAVAEEFVLSSPIGSLLKSAVATLGALGAVHSLAGATEFVASPSSNITGTVGQPLSA